MPKDLYYSPKGTPDEKVPRNVDGRNEFYINYTSTLVMVFRLNVGGSLIRPIEDKGFFREWYPDVRYFLPEGIPYRNSSFIPKYTEIPNYTALDDVYRTARFSTDGKMTVPIGAIPDFYWKENLTWNLSVDSGLYLIRLHFCGIHFFWQQPIQYLYRE